MRPSEWLRRVRAELDYLRDRGRDDPHEHREQPVKYLSGRCYVKRGGQWVETDMPYQERETR